jgi:hypothetical protein
MARGGGSLALHAIGGGLVAHVVPDGGNAWRSHWLAGRVSAAGSLQWAEDHA